MSSTRSGGGSVLWLLVAAQFSAFVDRNLTSAMAPQIKASFHLSDAALGALQGPAFIALFTVGVFAAGLFATHSARLKILGGCLVLWTAGSWLMAASSSVGVLIAGRLLLGLGQALFGPCALAVFADRALGPRRARALSGYTAASSVGRSAAFVIAGLVLMLLAATPLADSGWRGATILMTLPNLLLAVGLFFAREDQPGAGGGARAYHAAFGWLWAHRRAAGATILSASAAVMALQTLTAWGAPMLQRRFGLAPAAATFDFGLALIPAALTGHLGGGWLIDRFPKAWTLLDVLPIALVLALLAALLSMAAPTAFLSGIALTLAILGGAFSALASLTAMQAISPSEFRGAIGAVFLGVTSLVGFGVGPLTAGLLSDRHGATGEALAGALAWVSAGGAAAAIAAVLIGRNAWRRTADEIGLAHG